MVKRVIYLILVIQVLSIFCVLSLDAQTFYYIRAGASGSNAGSDWTNAYTQLPSTLVRGATYYVADGTYPGYTFDDPLSGSSYIIIKKATSSDHGSSAGWSSSYGDGVADFGPSGVRGSTGYIEINGQFEYGFRFNFGTNTQGFNFEGTTTDIKLLYCEFSGPGGPFGSNEGRGIDLTPSGGSTNNFFVSHCSIHGACSAIMMGSAPNTTIEHTKFYNIRNPGGGAHPNVVYIWADNVNNFTFRYNEIYDWNAQGVFVTDTGYLDGAYMYGNVFHDREAGGYATSIEIRQDGNHGRIYIYNNTFENCSAPTISSPILGNARNNLFYNALFWGGNYNTRYDHQYTWNNGAQSDTNGIANGSNPFVDLGNNNFRIQSTVSATAPRNKGEALSSVFRTDRLGNLRGYDGAWDIGAYEYTDGSPDTTPLQTPANVRLLNP